MRKIPEDEKISCALTLTLNNGHIIRTETLSGQRNQGIDIMTQMNLTNTCKTFQPNTKEYTFFPAPHGTFSKIDHILGTQNKYQQMKKKCNNSLCFIRSPCVKVGVKQQHKVHKIYKFMETGQFSSESPRVKEEIKRELKTF